MSWFHRDGDAERTIGELPTTLVQLLAAEKDAPAPGEVTAGRIGTRLERSLGAALLGGPGASAPGAGTPAGGVAAPAAAGPAGGVAAAGPSGLGAALAVKLGSMGGTAVVIGALAAGLGAGAAFVATGSGPFRAASVARPLPPVPGLVAPAAAPPSAPPAAALLSAPPAPALPSAPPAPALPSAPPAPALLSAPPAAPVPSAGAVVAPAAAPVVALRKSPRPRVPGAATRFSEELAALERAGALLRTSPRQALTALYAHERAFPDGQLVQERELFIIEAFARAGDAEKAETWATAFRLRHPGSTLEPRIARALAAGR